MLWNVFQVSFPRVKANGHSIKEVFQRQPYLDPTFLAQRDQNRCDVLHRQRRSFKPRPFPPVRLRLSRLRHFHNLQPERNELPAHGELPSGILPEVLSGQAN